jgi:uncharacterized protein with ParB-like and HNH nuclease domain
MKFHEIKQFPQIYYHVDIPIDYLKDWISKHTKDLELDLNPDFQRGYVWNKEQKILYIEYLLKNPTSGLELYFNHPGWMNSFEGDFVLVDGKQRINAILEFLNSLIPAYGCLYKEYEDSLRLICLSINIATLKTRKEVLQWYLDFNTGGTYHTQEEIQKVKELIEKEN